jgi:hypothetical protein
MLKMRTWSRLQSRSFNFSTSTHFLAKKIFRLHCVASVTPIVYAGSIVLIYPCSLKVKAIYYPKELSLMIYVSNHPVDSNGNTSASLLWFYLAEIPQLALAGC